MATVPVTLNVPTAALTRIQALADRYNAANGTTLTAKKFVILRLIEVLTPEAMTLEVEATERTAATAVAADLGGIT